MQGVGGRGGGNGGGIGGTGDGGAPGGDRRRGEGGERAAVAGGGAVFLESVPAVAAFLSRSFAFSFYWVTLKLYQVALRYLYPLEARVFELLASQKSFQLST